MAKTTILGDVVKDGQQTGQKVEVVVWRRQGSTYVCGKPGSGKSGFLHTVIQQDISQGRAVIVIDPHEDLVVDTIATMPEEMLKKTYLLDMRDEAYPFGLNLFEYHDFASDIERLAALGRIMHVFHRLWPKTEDAVLLNDILPNIALTFLEHKGLTFDDIPHFLIDESMRKRLTRNLKNAYIKNAWEAYDRKTPAKQQLARQSLELRLGDFLRNPLVRNILAQETSTINLRRAIEQREILLIKLPVKELAEAASLIGTILISLIHQATFSFADIAKEKRPTFSLFVDEFQNFDSPDFAELFKEGRKFGARVTIANQDRGDLIAENRRATTNAEIIVAFRPTPDDASELAPLFLNQEARVLPEDIYRNVLDHLYEHENPAVVAFAETYVNKLERALREKNDNYFNFGAGEVRFDPVFLKEELLEALRLLFYNTQKTGRLDDFVDTLDKKNYSRVVRGVARLLCFDDYLHWYYDNDATRFEVPFVYNDFQRNIVELEELKDLLASYQATSDDLKRFFCHVRNRYSYDKYKQAHYKEPTSSDGKHFLWQLRYLYKTQEAEEAQKVFLDKVAEYKTLADRYQSLHAYLSYLMEGHKQAYEKEVARTRNKLTEKIIEDRKWNLSKYQGHFYKPWWEKLDDWLFQGSVESAIEKMLPKEVINISYTYENGWSRFHIGCTVAEAQEGLMDVAHFITLLAEKTRFDDKGWGKNGWGYEPIQRSRDVDSQGLPVYREPVPLYGGKTLETVRQRLNEECEREYAFYEPRSTPEKLLETTRSELEKEIVEVEAKLQPLLQQREQQVAERTRTLSEALNARKEREKSRHDAFVTTLNNAIAALIKEPLGKKTMPAKSEVVQTLLSLPQRQALVRVGSDIYTMQTLQTLPKVPASEQQRRYQMIQEQTRKKYCRSRTNVEIALQEKHFRQQKDETEMLEAVQQESEQSQWPLFEEVDDE